MNQFSRNLMLWAIIVLAMVMLFNMFQQPQAGLQRVPYTEFLNKVDDGQVLSVTIQGHTLTGKTSDNKSIQTYAPQDSGLVNRLIEKKVEIKAEPPEESPWYMTLLVSWFPMLLLIGVWIFFMRQMQSGGGKAMSFPVRLCIRRLTTPLMPFGQDCCCTICFSSRMKSRLF